MNMNHFKHAVKCRGGTELPSDTYWLDFIKHRIDFPWKVEPEREEACACVLDDSISTCCVIHKKVSGEQPCEQTVYTCKPVNCACY